MSKRKALLSIIIPTKNRYNYVTHCIKALCMIQSPSLEIVVQDNSDNSELRNFIEREMSDSRIVYHHHVEDIDMVANFENALEHTTGEYICFIGDDDGVTSQIIQAVDWMKKEMLDVLTFNCPNYVWPDVEVRSLSKNYAGLLTYNIPTGKIKQNNVLRELNKNLDRGGQTIKDLPLLYHGIASKELLSRIYEIAGCYFPGSSPDMAVAIALAFFSKKHIKLDIPIIISGTAKKSGGGLGVAKKHHGDIRKMAHLPKDTANTWDSKVPFFWSGPTIYADSVIQALKRTGNGRMLKNFNFNYLYATLLVFNLNYRKDIYDTIDKNSNSSYIKILFYWLFLSAERAIIFVKNRLPFFVNLNRRRIKLNSLLDAVNYTQEEINKNKLPWNN